MLDIFITGGTIDVDRIEEGEQYVFEETYLSKMLKQGRCTLEVSAQVLFMKDSLYTTDKDRQKILDNCLTSSSDNILITHGTDSMTETAKILGTSLKNKTIVLAGAIIPYNQPNSDALFNLGNAIGATQYLSQGVYIAMHGEIFLWDNVRKNKEKECFERLR